MKIFTLLFFSCSLLCAWVSCDTGANKARVKKASTAVTQPVDTIGPEPDTVFLRKRLFAFFEAHKNEDVFDTSDYTYSAYWGPTDYLSYTVRAGHLFSDQHLHALIYYANGQESKMIIYLKKSNAWTKIYEGDSIAMRGVAPEFADWNGDGVKDISIKFQNTWSENFVLWLVDKNGDHIPHKRFFRHSRPYTR